MESTASSAHMTDSLAVLRRMLGYMQRYWLWAVIAFVGTISSNILIVAVPTILRDVIDVGLIGKMPLIYASPPVMVEMIDGIGFEYGNPAYMLAAGILVILLGVARGVTGFLFRYFGERMSHYIAYDVRNQVYQKIQTQSFSYHDEARTGTLITRAISDVDEMQRFFAFGLIDGVNTLLLIVGVAIVMIATSPLLALIGLLPLIPLAFMSRKFAMTVDPLWKRIMERLQKLGNHIQENSVGAEVVRAFDRQDYEIEKFSNNNEQLFQERLGLVKEWSAYLPLSAFIIAFSTALVLFFGGLMQQAEIGGVTVGVVVAFNAYILTVAQPIRFLGFVILLMTQAVSSARRVFEILDEPEEIVSKPDAVDMRGMRGHVQFKDVRFRYNSTAHDVLKDINFEAKPGQVTAIVGPTGGGKSSLVSLIPRFYDVYDGQVLIDGVDVRDADLSTLRRNVGFVLQTSLLFSATLRDNLRYGNPDATDEEMIAAAKAANAHDFIMEFPEGYDTLVGERGVTLSGGQKQRVAIARALLINPRILVLDDSTSSVDTRTEYDIQEALKYLMHGRTTFVIAQRLNSVQNADQILVMDHGEIVERGTHDELMANNGYYADIYNMQLADQNRVKQELMALGQFPDDGEDSEERSRYQADAFSAIMDRSSGD